MPDSLTPHLDRRGFLKAGTAVGGGLVISLAAATLASSIASIPGHPLWGVAPASMAWQGKSLRQICMQLKDPAKNGGRSLEKIREHAATDPLVGWAWHPGEGRLPAPGTQQQFGELIRAWIATGAQCPD